MVNNALIKRIKEKEKNIGGPERKEDQRKSGVVLTITNGREMGFGKELCLG